MIPQFPEFKKLELSDRAEITQIIKQFEPYSDFNFTSMWSWDTTGTFEVSRIKDILIVRFADYITYTPFYSFIGTGDVTATIDAIYGAFGDVPIKLVPEAMVPGIDVESYDVQEDADNYDYVYSAKLLAELQGKPFETKRNLISRFHRFTPEPRIDFHQLDRDEAEQKVYRLFSSWEHHKMTLDEQFEAKHEFQAIQRLFESSVVYGLEICCLYSKTSLIGFNIFEQLDDTQTICHFAKTNQNFTGANDFLLHSLGQKLHERGSQFINYEQDLGIDTLRHSKLSFRPVHYLKKYVVTRK